MTHADLNKIQTIVNQITNAIQQTKYCRQEGLLNAEKAYLQDASDLALELSRLTAIEWSKAVNGETIVKR
jgi:hypothetical protein